MENANARRVGVRSIAWLDVSPVKSSSAVIANSTKKLSTKLSLRLPNPVSPRSLQTGVALAAPRIGVRVVRVYRGEEPDAAALTKAFDDVLADECLLLLAVLCAIDNGFRVGHARSI